MDNLKNIEIIIRLLKEHNLDYIVINPGGTNQAFVKAIQDDSFFHCYSIVDERSALYFAIGLYLQIKKPIVMSCTSAQATRNYIPGLTEAFYKKVPILAITMSKHPRFNYQEYMQAPDQTSLPKDCVKKSYMLPCISDEEDIMHSIRLTNEAILETTRNTYGPVQLCCPWLDFPLIMPVDQFRTIKRISNGNISSISLSGKKVLVCIGEHLPFDEELKKEIELFCETNNAVVYCNHLSNYHGKYSLSGTIALLTVGFDSFLNKYVPDILITLGGQTGDYPFYNLFSRNDIKGLEHWSISPEGLVKDTYDKLTNIIQMSEYEFFYEINRLNNTVDNHSLFENWREWFEKTNTDIDVPFSAVSIAQSLSGRIPSNSIIQFSILNSLRIWNMFKLDSSIECYSNVGAFGIDGGMSTIIGQSVVTDELAFLVIGDLAFLYDMNSIAIRHIRNNLRIILINNNGGIEFKLWGAKPQITDRYVSAAGHFKNAEGWANTCGFEYISVRTKEEFEHYINALTTESDKPILLEAFVKDDDESKAYLSMLDENTNFTLVEKTKNILSNFIK